MGSFFKSLGWVIALLLCVAVGLLYLWGKQQADQAKALAAKCDELQKTLTTAEAAKTAAETKATELAKKAAATPQPAPSAAESFAAAAAALASTAKAKLGPDGKPAPDKEASSNPMANMFSGEQGKKMLEAGLDMSIGMQYGQYFTDAHLSPEVEQQVRGIIRQRLSAQQEMAFKGGQGDPKEMQKTLQKSKDDAHAALAKILSAQELADLDEYETAMPARMLRQGMEMQLGMVAPNLQQEARTRAVDVLVEEMAPILDAQRTGGAGAIQQNVQLSLDAYARTRERLGQELQPEQMAIIERFLAQQEQVTQTAAAMFGNAQQQQQPKQEAAPK